MTNIINWEYYSSLYNKVGEDEFPAYELRAEKEVRNVIGVIRWVSITSDTFGYDVLQDAICKVIDQLKDYDDSGAGKGVTSVSNDGYSESYAITDAGVLYDNLKSIIREALSGTGLVGAY